MKTVCIVMKNADFTEGRGPMSIHKVFSEFVEAEAYVMSQEGIYGSQQGRSSYGNSNPNDVGYNGYDIRTVHVETCAVDVLANELVERRQKEEKRLAETKKRALSKLSYDERQSLGL